MTVTGKTGTTYHIDANPIGSGGEGDVFRAFIPKVVKIYKSEVLTHEMEEKIKIMVNNPPDESVLSQVAWPLDVVYNENAQCKGFIMSEMRMDAELGEIYKYPSALPISVHQKINIAQNICAVISEVHKAGYVFGDFNPRNIGIDKNTGLVSFLDTDSYHVVAPAGNMTYRCNVCAPGYAAPELLEKCSDFISTNPSASKNAYAQTPLPTFTKETDNFALAIHMFKLLMNGYTPFGGIIETASVSQSSPGVGDMAVRRDSYCFKPGYKHQSAAIPALEAFPDEIAALFARAFIDGRHDPKQRPTAVEWHSALSKYAKSLVTCRNNPLHQHDSKNDVCPYCEADRRFGAVISEDTSPIVSLKQTAYTPPPRVAPQSSIPTKNSAAAPTTTASKKNITIREGLYSTAMKQSSMPTKKSAVAPATTTSKKYITIREGWYNTAMKRYDTSITELHLYNRGLSNADIVPLMFMKNLTTLRLDHNKINDLTPLSDLINLRILMLEDNNISDITPLSNLTNLERLDLGGNYISDITPFSRLTKLKTLMLDSNPVIDWSPVAHVPSVSGRP